MNRSIRFVIILTVFLPALANAGLLEFLKSGTSGKLQHDFDIARLKDVATLSGYIEEYKKVTGKYPFEGEVEHANYVFIATQWQAKYTKGGPPYKYKRTSTKKFVAELQSVLGSEIEIPFDLQKIYVNKPNFYIYKVVDDLYFLAVHVHHNFLFARKVADYYYKIEVTNASHAIRKGTWLREQLLVDEAYKQAVAAQPYNPGYAERLRDKLGGNNAF